WYDEIGILCLPNPMKPAKDNIFKNIPDIIPEELSENLLARETFKIERIVSQGHCTPAGQWCDEASDEWVLLLEGKAVLGYEDGCKINMGVGDYVFIPAHTRHRVEWTQPESNTIWLAIHFVPP
ncbi:cupin domain-containing protein, partial [Methyloglobulus sp.]|uniref:cupin domain-containing protein n=1 Tax=Methyloglobulus sp. TaxID=2518622 RepID=UPI0039891627